MDITTIGIDLAKNSYSLVGVLTSILSIPYWNKPY